MEGGLEIDRSIDHASCIASTRLPLRSSIRVTSHAHVPLRPLGRSFSISFHTRAREREEGNTPQKRMGCPTTSGLPAGSHGPIGRGAGRIDSHNSILRSMPPASSSSTVPSRRGGASRGRPAVLLQRVVPKLAWLDRSIDSIGFEIDRLRPTHTRRTGSDAVDPKPHQSGRNCRQTHETLRGRWRSKRKRRASRASSRQQAAADRSKVLLLVGSGAR